MSTLTAERADLLETLAEHRYFLRYTVQGLTDEQAAGRPTVSELSLAGLIKHVAGIEAQLGRFIEGGPEAMDGPEARGDWRRVPEPADTRRRARGLRGGRRRTDELVASLPDLDVPHPLPEAPWFEPGARWSARRVSCTSSPRPPSTPGTRTSSGSHSTVRSRWAQGPAGPRIDAGVRISRLEGEAQVEQPVDVSLRLLEAARVLAGGAPVPCGAATPSATQATEMSRSSWSRLVTVATHDDLLAIRRLRPGR